MELVTYYYNHNHIKNIGDQINHGIRGFPSFVFGQLPLSWGIAGNSTQLENSKPVAVEQLPATGPGPATGRLGFLSLPGACCEASPKS